jgi:transposase/predicted nucleic acid-binding Zn ribbon protein
MQDYQTQRVMLYFQIKQLLSEKFNKTQISEKLGISRTTVHFYSKMSEEEFLEWVRQIRKKSGKLSGYEERIKTRLGEHPELSSYQIHDWLLEKYPQLEVSRRAVTAFVRKLRKVYHLPKPVKHKQGRSYMAVEDLPYGQQAQVDFGVYTMATTTGEKQKVYFMIMVLSRSRYKHVYFLNRPFTTIDVVRAHEQAFVYFGGHPKELVYDQDKLMVVSENGGDILYTEKFDAYQKVRKFELFVCRKKDPETKGKSESVVKFVKTNFLNARAYINEEVLNAECLAWLKRTGNGQVHGTTKRIPAQDFVKERQHLLPLGSVSLDWLTYTEYTVRKDNLISYKSNRYSVPEGTYENKKTKVWVKVEKHKYLLICKADKVPIARHEICLDKGQTIINNNHRRDRSAKIKELTAEVSQLFSDPQAAQKYLAQLQQSKPRYIRDQLLLIRKTASKSQTEQMDQALEFCLTNNIYNASDFSSVVEKIKQEENTPLPQVEDLVSPSIDLTQLTVQPYNSSITDYEAIVNPKYV